MRVFIALCLLAITAGCSSPGYYPSGQARNAVDNLRDVEHAGQYMINDFNPCRTRPAVKKASYSANLNLDRKGNLTPTARIQVSGQC